MRQICETFISWFWFEDEETGNPEYMKSVLAFFAFCVVVYFIYNVVYVIKSSTNSIMR